MKNLFLFVSGLVALGVLLSEPAGAAPRKIIAEMFTSTTCAPCYNADNFYFNQWLPNYGGADQIVTIAYHTWIPVTGDPMYAANPGVVSSRYAYYMSSGFYAPHMYIDGFVDGGSGYTTWPGAIEPRFLDSSPISITLTGTRNGNVLDMNATIHAEAVVNSSSWRVRWVVVESQISEPQNSGSGYVPFIHDWVLRGMYPDANGSAITISQGQTVQIPRTITLNSGWVANNCKVIVFVQNNTDKKVQNAEVINVDLLTGVPGDGAGTPATFALEQNYPNPFNPTTSINYSVSRQSFVTVKVFNLIGEEIRTLVAQVQGTGNHHVEWDGTASGGKAVPSGVYLYQMTAGGFRDLKKMVLLK